MVQTSWTFTTQQIEIQVLFLSFTIHIYCYYIFPNFIFLSLSQPTSAVPITLPAQQEQVLVVAMDAMTAGSISAVGAPIMPPLPQTLAMLHMTSLEFPVVTVTGGADNNAPLLVFGSRASPMEE